MDPQLHEFIGEMKEFKRALLEQIGEMRTEIASLRGFRLKVAGGASLIAAAVTVGIRILFHG